MAHDDAGSSGVSNEKVGENVRIFLRGKTWYANFQVNKRQYRESLKTQNKKLARRRAAQIDGKIIAGDWQPAIEPATVSDTKDAYIQMLESEGRAPKTMQAYKRILKNVADLADRLRIKDMSGLDLRFFDAYRKMRTDDGAAAKTKFTESVVLRQLIRYALTRGLLTTDPMRGVKLSKPKPTRQPCWTHEEVQWILATASADFRPPLTLLAETGMRFGELAWLTWDDVDFVQNVLHIRPKDNWKPKTKDERSVPLSQKAKEMLLALPRKHRWVTTMPPSKSHPEPGRQWTERRLLAGLKRILKPLGLTGKLHTYRHSFISYALSQNTPASTLKKWVGHIDSAILDMYTHVFDPDSQAAMRRLSSAKTSAASKESSDGTQDANPAQTQHKAKETNAAEGESA